MPKKDECIVHVDYSENYNKQQDVTQSAYFGHATFGILKAADIFAPLILPSSEVSLTIVIEANDHSSIVAYTKGCQLPVSYGTPIRSHGCV